MLFELLTMWGRPKGTNNNKLFLCASYSVYFKMQIIFKCLTFHIRRLNVLNIF